MSIFNYFRRCREQPYQQKKNNRKKIKSRFLAKLTLAFWPFWVPTNTFQIISLSLLNVFKFYSRIAFGKLGQRIEKNKAYILSKRLSLLKKLTHAFLINIQIVSLVLTFVFKFDFPVLGRLKQSIIKTKETQKLL